MQVRYRQDYDGEFVVLRTEISNGSKKEIKDWVPNPIENYHISHRAAVIGSGVDQSQFDYARLQRHRGGLLGKKRLQTYGTGDLWKQMKFDFFVSTDGSVLNEIVDHGYDQSATIYTNARHIVEMPGRFYLIPFRPMLDNLATNIYMAAFDGHEEIFLLGYTKETQAQTHYWQRDVDQVLGAYSNVRFRIIGVENNIPDLWKRHTNVECWPYRKFVTYCDV